jgi:hypothetical protein
MYPEASVEPKLAPPARSAPVEPADPGSPGAAVQG